MTRPIFGIRREDLNKTGEKRVAIVPSCAQKIIDAGFTLVVQPAHHPSTNEEKRIFQDQLYKEVGATIQEDLSNVDIVFGLKEIQVFEIQQHKVYYFFSHTHKGQAKNREMLHQLVKNKNTLIDYERITHLSGERVLTSFTYFAGYAGMIDSLWTLGQRWKHLGQENPFSRIPQSIEKEDVHWIRSLLSKEVHTLIREQGTPQDRPPVVVCILGKGKTSIGAQQILDLLPTKEIQLHELESIFVTGTRDQVYKLVLDVPDFFRLQKESKHRLEDYESWSVDQQFAHYLDHPDDYESNMEGILPYITLVMNCTLWSPKFPRVISKKLMKKVAAQFTTLQVIGDITCDPNGGIEFSQETWIDQPVYIYEPNAEAVSLGFEGQGIAVMAVSNLPCEFSKDASCQFSEDLDHLLYPLLHADYTTSFDQSGLPEEIKRATILWKGTFTKEYSYMQKYLQSTSSL